MGIWAWNTCRRRCRCGADCNRRCAHTQHYIIVIGCVLESGQRQRYLACGGDGCRCSGGDDHCRIVGGCAPGSLVNLARGGDCAALGYRNSIGCGTARALNLDCLCVCASCRRYKSAFRGITGCEEGAFCEMSTFVGF